MMNATTPTMMPMSLGSISLSFLLPVILESVLVLVRKEYYLMPRRANNGGKGNKSRKDKKT